MSMADNLLTTLRNVGVGAMSPYEFCATVLQARHAGTVRAQP